jgi:DNA-binding protein H-NS
MPKLSAAAIKAKIETLQKQLAAAEAQKAPATRRVFALMKKLGVTLDDLLTVKSTQNKRVLAPSKGQTRKVAIKFRDSAGNSWTGRGKTPRWLVEAEKAGKNRDAFRI